jgi:prepilin-type N-terminal cleavage/methylation domain-containing protein
MKNIRYTIYKDGFSLIEVLIAIILVGLAITALLATNQSFTIANSAGTDLSTAEFLIEQIRELMAMSSY